MKHFRGCLRTGKPPKVEKIIDGYSGFLFLDRRGKAMVSYQWEKRFQRAVEKHNKENKRKLPKITPHILPPYLLYEYGEERY